jgi:hypothetical protein
MLIKLSTWSCLVISMHDEVTVRRLIIVTLKGWKISNICEKPNESNFYSGRQYEQFEVRECLILFGAESFVF